MAAESQTGRSRSPIARGSGSHSSLETALYDSEWLQGGRSPEEELLQDELSYILWSASVALGVLGEACRNVWPTDFGSFVRQVF